LSQKINNLEGSKTDKSQICSPSALKAKPKRTSHENNATQKIDLNTSDIVKTEYYQPSSCSNTHAVSMP
jgi:hypothetical protein